LFFTCVNEAFFFFFFPPGVGTVYAPGAEEVGELFLYLSPSTEGHPFSPSPLSSVRPGVGSSSRRKNGVLLLESLRAFPFSFPSATPRSTSSFFLFAREHERVPLFSPSFGRFRCFLGPPFPFFQ